ncbi:MAG TPA: diacylglycerol kinase family protein [Thermoanaerobaculia bacterium]|nr:diacylglycerol kinase family protein [Thermoanaerobaculia bacterium]
MTDFRGTLFLNTRSGSSTDAVLSEVEDRARAESIELIEITHGVDFRAVVQERLAAGRKLFITGGGDGTIHHIVQAMVSTEAVLGILPLGTMNHLARDLNIPLDWKEAFNLALDGPVRQIDAAIVNGRYFLNNMMLGVYPSMLYHRERLREEGGKLQAYARALPLAIRSFPSVSLELEAPGHSEVVRTQLFAVSVNPYDLTKPGLIAPKSTLDRGRLALYWFPFSNRWSFLWVLLRYLFGHIDRVNGFREMTTQKLQVTASRPRMRFAIDGEVVEMTSPLNISIVPSSLNVKLPALADEKLTASGA